MEGAPAGGGAGALHGECQALGAEPVLCVCGAGGLPCEVPAYPEEGVPRQGQELKPGGVHEAAVRGEGTGEGAAGAGDGDDRGHGDTGERAGLHHGGGGAGREGDGVAEGEGEGDTDTAEAVPEAAEVREGEGDKERGGVRDQEREGRVAGAGVARDEGAVPEGGRGGEQGVPAQPEAHVRHSVLPGQP